VSTDRNGNQLTSKPALGATSVFSWDEEARLRSVDTGTNVTAFVYDAGGTRTHKSGSSGTTLDPNAYLTVRNGTEVTRHIDAGGQRVSSVADGVDERACWHHADHLGSTQYTTTQTGAVHEYDEHLPFGEQWISHASAMDLTALSLRAGASSIRSRLCSTWARGATARGPRAS
jgi:hypothetical protein